MMSSNLRKLQHITLTAILSAAAFAVYLMEFPLLPSSFLKMDFSDIIAAVGGVILGPWAAVIIELIKNLLELLVKGLGTTMGFGNLSNFSVGVAFCVPLSILYRRFIHSNDRKYLKLLAVTGLSAVIMISIGIGVNYFITPVYFKAFLGQVLSHEYIMGFVWTATLFNLIKSAILSLILCLILPLTVKKIKKMID